MEEFPKCIRIDSRFRTSGASTDFRIQLPTAIAFPEGVVGYVSAVSLPHSWWNVEEGVSDKLCVIDSACYPFDVPLKGRIPLLPVLGPLVFKKLYGRNLMRAYFRDEVWSGRPGLDVRRVDEYFDDFDPPDAREAAYEALKSTVDLASLGPKIARIRKPTLVIWGDDDRLFPIAIAERLVRAIPGARLEVIENSGHAPNEQHPEATAKLLCDFFG